MAGEEVGVEVCFEYALDAQTETLRVGEVLRHVALRIDHHGAAGGLVADQVAEQ